MIRASALLMACAAYGQGQFFFNTHDTTAHNVIAVTDAAGNGITGSDWFLEGLSGKDANSLTPLAPTLALNRTGAGAGFANPFSATYTVASMAGGTSITVGYRVYEGTSYDVTSLRSALQLASSPVVLTEPPMPPNEVSLGTHTINLPQPGLPIKRGRCGTWTHDYVHHWTGYTAVAFRANRGRYFPDESGENGTKWRIVVWKV